MKINKKKLLLEILHYSEYIARRYYSNYWGIFEQNATSLDDLKQEAKIITIKLFKEYSHLHGKNKFDIKKFICRGVGWRLRDLMKKAKCRAKKTLYSEEEINFDIIPNTSIDGYDELSSVLKCGFSLNDIYKDLSERDVIVLKFVTGVDRSEESYSEYYSSISSIYSRWNTSLKNRLAEKLIAQLKELNGTN